METSNTLVAEFKIVVIRMLSELRTKVDKLSENLNKEIENIKIEVENKKELVRNEEYNN